MVSSMIRQVCSLFHSLQAAASRRRSRSPASAISVARSTIDCIAKVVAVMSAILCAMASCLPICLPHCTRLFAQRRHISMQVLAVPTEPLGIDSRPSLSVVSAILRPRPSSPIKFSAGTRTFSKVMTALANARKPMKWQRSVTSTPSQSVSTTKALILSISGCCAITTSNFASVPFVHQSLVPFRM